ncbi:MAG TPA: cytochrome c3 family protein [Sideroxyarcus sp.]|nr:cytochrome c3 family protein [Sideroxyarcus sp.]
MGSNNYWRWTMKRLGRTIGGLIAIALTVASLQAVAAETKLGGRDFNHTTTGYPLSGGHAIAACETCHVGGVFKGTPRNCDGCHAVGKRILATPKSNAHIVTDAPCESCHFNTSTFLGARYNHGTAVPGQCLTCHNGRLSMQKPATHNTGNKATKSCDSCHRSTSWLPASWNHTSAAACSSCHVSSPEVSAPNRKPVGHAAPALKGTLECDSCHNYSGWYPNRFKHNTGAACTSCHDGVLATGKPAGHVATTDECNQCHYTAVAWVPALGGKPANHIPYNAGVACTSCHVGLGTVNVTTLHTYSVASSTCATCHIKPNPYEGNNQKTKSNHDGSSGNNCTGCHEHSSAGSYGKW